ncbi:hypothetical protein VZ52_16040 [Ralstonia mannitolilytica]|nr:hypothetical protein VZ52_16040 [Ralstonia mannitolilytica]
MMFVGVVPVVVVVVVSVTVVLVVPMMVLVRRAGASRRRVGGEWPLLEAQYQAGESQRQYRARGQLRGVGHGDDDFIAVPFRRTMPVAQGVADAERCLGCHIRQYDHHDRLGSADHDQHAFAVVMQHRAIEQPALSRQVDADLGAAFAMHAHAAPAGVRGRDTDGVGLASSESRRIGAANDPVHDQHGCPVIF